VVDKMNTGLPGVQQREKGIILFAASYYSCPKAGKNYIFHQQGFTNTFQDTKRQA
jgi:hypothetical protein